METQLVVDRINKDLASQATILQAVMTAAVASFGKGGREASSALNKMIKGLAGDG